MHYHKTNKKKLNEKINNKKENRLVMLNFSIIVDILEKLKKPVKGKVI